MRPLVLAAALTLPWFACTDAFHSVGLFDKVDTTLPGGKSAAVLGVGDLDGDGRGDIVLVDTSGQVNVLISKGDGNFASGVSYPLQNQASRSIAVGDLNGDGRADVVVGNIDQNNISLFINLGDGRLMQPQQQTQDVGCRPTSIVLYDMTADGKPDLVIGCGSQPNEIHILKNMGPGSFGGMYSLAITTATNPQNPPGIRAIAVGKLDGDGLPDIVVATDTDLRILNDPKETGHDFHDYGVSVPLTMSPMAIGLGDVNGNGVTDISALVDGGKSVQVFESATGGTYNQLVVYHNLDNVGYGTTNTLAVVDMSSDGKSDFIVTMNGPMQSQLKLGISRGEVGMVDQPITATYAYPSNVPNPLPMCDNCLSLGDVNGDSKPDVVLRNGGRISVLVSASR